MTSNKSNQPTPNQVDAFVSAATDGEVAKLDTLLAQQPRLIDAHTPQGMTALFAASYSNQLHAARWLVDHGADTKGTLLYAAEGGAMDVVRYLVESGSHPDGEPGEPPRSTPLVCATSTHDLHRAVAQYLIEKGATIDIFSAVGLSDHARIRDLVAPSPDILNIAPSPLEDGFRPLHLAIRRRDSATAMLLIDLGADCRSQSAHGLTPLPMAVASELHEVSARLRADLEPLTAIELLAIEEYEAVRAMLVAGGKLDLPEVARQRLLHVAAALGLSKALTFLIEDLGVPADLPGPNYSGKGPDQTALAYATMKGHPSAVQSLLRAGADVNADLGGNMLAIHLAAMIGNAEITRILAAYGGDLERRDDMNEATPLQWAKHNRRSDVARLLESLGSVHRPGFPGGLVT